MTQEYSEHFLPKFKDAVEGVENYPHSKRMQTELYQVLEEATEVGTCDMLIKDWLAVGAFYNFDEGHIVAYQKLRWFPLHFYRLIICQGENESLQYSVGRLTTSNQINFYDKEKIITGQPSERIIGEERFNVKDLLPYDMNLRV